MALAQRDSLHEVSYFEEMHKDSKGIVALMKLYVDKEKEKRCVMRYGRYSTLVKKHLNTLGEEDLFFTQNTFKALSKAQDQLLTLNALYIDLDYYNTGYTREQVLGNIDILVQDKEIPRPTFIVDSGNGFYLIWKIKPVPAHVLMLWRKLEQSFYQKLKYLGADAKCLEPSRVFRVDGSINSKNQKAVHIIDYQPITYTINDLQMEYLLPFPHKERITRPKYTFTKKENVLYLNESSTLYHKRIKDIQTLVEIRDGKMKDCREMACFLTRYWTYCITQDHDRALAAAEKLNEQFREPLSKREIEKYTKPPQRALNVRAYRYSKARLIELLKITPREETRLESIIGAKENDKRKKKKQRRNDSGLNAREQKKQDTKKEILIYYKKGYTQKQIAEALGLSVRTIKRYYTEIKEEG